MDVVDDKMMELPQYVVPDKGSFTDNAAGGFPVIDLME